MFKLNHQGLSMEVQDTGRCDFECKILCVSIKVSTQGHIHRSTNTCHVFLLVCTVWGI